ncbi:MAG TPA: FHA domain-containing protein [Nitrospiraceae bacterium]
MTPTGQYALMVVKGPDQPHMFMLTQFPARIGRSENDQVRLTDPAVSTAHCEILSVDGVLWLMALNPDPPVTVDGTPVKQGTPALLTANRSKIVVGGTTLALRDISALLGKMESDLDAEERLTAPGKTANASGPRAHDQSVSDLVPPTMMFKSETQAMMMADVCDSTGQAYSVSKAQGSDQANKLMGKAIQTFYNLFDRHAQAHHVLHVLKPGDAVFATFQSPEDCLAVCCKVLSDLVLLRPKLQEKGLMPLNVRVAAHYAPVLHSADQSQLFGLPIHLTNRLQSLTSEQVVGILTGDFPKINRIFLTAEIYKTLSAAWAPLTWNVGSFTVKGFAEEAFPVYGLKWEELIQRKLVG